MPLSTQFGTLAKDLPVLVSIPGTQLVILPNPTTGELFRSTVAELLALASASIDLSLKADLVNGKVPVSQLPSYVDNILEFATIAALPNPGAGSTIYVITTGVDIDKLFRWSGTMYIQVGGPGYDGSDVIAEAAIRAAADIWLQNQIDAEIAARTTADTNEATTRAAADTNLQNQITAEVTARTNADTTLQNNINAEANTRASNDGILQGNINLEAAARIAADAALQLQIDNKLDAADYNDRYKGKYTTLVALQAAHPTSNAGDYAQVDTGTANPVINYNWDDEEGWVQGTAIGPTIATTDDLPEGSTNLYFTGARAIAAVDISGKVDKITGKGLSTEDYTTGEKTKLAGIEAGAQVNDPNTTLQGNTFNGANQLVKLDGTGKLPAIDGSQLTGLPASGVVPNAAITPGTKTKITYDAKGLVTAGADTTTSDISEGTNLYFTQARALATLLAGFTSGSGTVTSADTILQAIEKLSGNAISSGITINQKILSIAGNYSQSII